jgi:hypothetical protein
VGDATLVVLVDVLVLDVGEVGLLLEPHAASHTASAATGMRMVMS